MLTSSFSNTVATLYNAILSDMSHTHGHSYLVVMVTEEVEREREREGGGSVLCEVHFGTKEEDFVIEVRAKAVETVEH